jgi:hypothetical protein
MMADGELKPWEVPTIGYGLPVAPVSFVAPPLSRLLCRICSSSTKEYTRAINPGRRRSDTINSHTYICVITDKIGDPGVRHHLEGQHDDVEESALMLFRAGSNSGLASLSEQMIEAKNIFGNIIVCTVAFVARFVYNNVSIFALPYLISTRAPNLIWHGLRRLIRCFRA